MVRALKLLPVVAATVALVAGCGSGSEDVVAADPAADVVSSTPTPAVVKPPLPRCAVVWVADQQLPDEYIGCRTGGRTEEKSLRCENGQRLFTHAGRFFAVPGGRVFMASGALADDAQFQRMNRVCSA